MSLKDDKQQNIQMQLDFSPALTGEAREVRREETESSGATSDSENPARTNRLMEEVCERDNLKEALRQVKANKSSAGVDRMTVDQLANYLKQHWPDIREQLLSGTYEPKPVRRVEIPTSRTVECANSAFQTAYGPKTEITLRVFGFATLVVCRVRRVLLDLPAWEIERRLEINHIDVHGVDRGLLKRWTGF